VGYSIRFDDMTSAKTVLQYMTDVMLLREVLSDPLLKAYTVIFLDEAHERTVRTDILFGILKRIQAARASTPRPLKLVVMSATLEAEKFAVFFCNAPILRIAGRTHPVTVFYTREPQSDYLDAALVTVMQLHLEEPPGDILVFLTGQDEIEGLEELLEEHARRCPPEAPKLLVRPLYAALPPALQVQVFEPTPADCRKVILATNIAETSVTINGIRYVVDSGFAKERVYDARIGLESLLPQPVSKASARQRSGRAGREAPGRAYRLYTEDTFFRLPESTTPEIQRCSLAAVALSLKAYGVDDVMAFEYMDKPAPDALVSALEQLFGLGALDDQGRLTDEGRAMAHFPVDPMLARVLLAAKELECGEEAVALIALLSVESIFYSPRQQREQAEEARRKFISSHGDHITLLNVLRAYERVNSSIDWCTAHFLNARALHQVMLVREQLRRTCGEMSVPLVSCGDDRARVLKALLAGYFLHTAVRQRDGSYRTLKSKQTVAIHPSSTLAGKQPACVLYHELVQTSRQFIRTVSAIDIAWIASAAPRYFGRVQAAIAP